MISAVLVVGGLTVTQDIPILLYALGGLRFLSTNSHASSVRTSLKSSCGPKTRRSSARAAARPRPSERWRPSHSRAATPSCPPHQGRPPVAAALRGPEGARAATRDQRPTPPSPCLSLSPLFMVTSAAEVSLHPRRARRGALTRAAQSARRSRPRGPPDRPCSGERFSDARVASPQPRMGREVPGVRRSSPRRSWARPRRGTAPMKTCPSRGAGA